MKRSVRVGGWKGLALVALGCFPGWVGGDIALVERGTEWRYWAEGTDLGTAWREPEFSDEAWPVGRAELGYGDGTEATAIGPGGNDTLPGHTFYFRRAFDLISVGSVSNLTAGLMRDDAAVVYLNGSEVWRHNLGPGLVTASTPAEYVTTSESVWFYTNLSPGLLRSGRNVVAVEVHQAVDSAADLSFDFELLGNRQWQVPLVTLVYPGDGELIKSHTDLILHADAYDPDGEVLRVEYFVDGQPVGTNRAPPFRHHLRDLSPGMYSVAVRAIDVTGMISTTRTARVTVGGRTTRLIEPGSTWRFLDDGTDQGTGWRELGFDDSEWGMGPAELGYGDGDETTLVQYGPFSSNKHVTTYFRHRFTLVDAASISGLRLGVVRDDGVVVYLNGDELVRDEMPSGEIFFDTMASRAVGGSEEKAFVWFTLPADLLRSGTNVLAAEIHQANRTSSDISFDLQLLGIMPGELVAVNGPDHDEVVPRSSALLTANLFLSDLESANVTFLVRKAPPPPGRNFSMVIIPDTQNYTGRDAGGEPAIFYAQRDWIIRNQPRLNIAHVIHVGDCVQRYDNGGDDVEWRYATNAVYPLATLEWTGLPEGIPYGVALGNHDQPSNGDAVGEAVFYNQYFGTNHYLGRSYYGGPYGSNNDNFHELLEVEGCRFLLLFFEYNQTPDPDVHAWASDLLDTHRDRHAIVASHYLIGTGHPAAFGTQGAQIYQDLKQHENLLLMVCGHVLGEGRRTDTEAGHSVHTLMSDYQGRPFGGDGWLRVLEFSPSNQVVHVSTYSPTLGRFEADADSQFSLPCDLHPVGTSSFAILQTNENVSAGQTVQATWAGLERDTVYEWMVEIEVNGESHRTSIRRFVTTGNFQPTIELVRPFSGEVFVEPAHITLEARAEDEDGLISRVEWYEGGTWLGWAFEEPFAAEWSDASAGTYTITASTMDNGGSSAFSEPVVITVLPHDQVTTLVDPRASWSYLVTGEDPDPGWTGPDYDDSAWVSGAAPLGYGSGDVATLLPSGPDPQHKPVSMYFRHHLFLPYVPAFTNLLLCGWLDDGAVLCVNGTVLGRYRMPAGEITPQTLALPDDGEEIGTMQMWLDPALLRTGWNVVTVELHLDDPASESCFVDLELIGAGLRRDPPTLHLAVDGEWLILDWAEPGFFLQQAEAMTGPWWSVPPPVCSGPVWIRREGSAAYFRLSSEP